MLKNIRRKSLPEAHMMEMMKKLPFMVEIAKMLS
jgi:hypothetical protein